MGQRCFQGFQEYIRSTKSKDSIKESLINVNRYGHILDTGDASILASLTPTQTLQKRARLVWIAYFLDPDDNYRLKTKVINFLLAQYLKTKIHRKGTAVCANCQRQYHILFRHEGDILKLECPCCNDPDITLLPAGSLDYVDVLLINEN
jgi:hypothetical protein